MKLACCILSVPFAFVLLWTQTAYADPFAGSYSLSVAYDNDISDGVVILRDSAVDLTITRNSPTELTASIAGEGGPVTIYEACPLTVYEAGPVTVYEACQVPTYEAGPVP